MRVAGRCDDDDGMDTHIARFSPLGMKYHLSRKIIFTREKMHQL
jgi:hypothetical protein